MTRPLHREGAREVLEPRARRPGVLTGVGGRREVEDPPNRLTRRRPQEGEVHHRARDVPCGIHAGAQTRRRTVFRAHPDPIARVSKETGPVDDQDVKRVELNKRIRHGTVRRGLVVGVGHADRHPSAQSRERQSERLAVRPSGWGRPGNEQRNPLQQAWPQQLRGLDHAQRLSGGETPAASAPPSREPPSSK